jgi:hypothetical protein
MDKRLANDIIQHFDMKTMQVLEAYIQDREEYLFKQMKTSLDSDGWRKFQGACQELDILRKIREYAIAIKES